ncbi:hypothetical protein ARALYDRAFT_910854 [Arabidopsis lyrata subsp. lyrata]|uniref:Uncharacterized protein n=1 Tax=Arabidopsis lyrata subsp. lyrata TaxID=81972 RepID=D7M659_ARALL|nr:hypothetical protein ARALYDRAFT_910854 [Arabidopsis lyrata subsp. lyrata]
MLVSTLCFQWSRTPSETPSLLWINNYSLRTLVFASTTSFEDSHGRSVTNSHSITILANDFKQRAFTITFKNSILLSHEDVDCYKRDPEPLFCFSKQALLDYKTVVSRISASVILRVDLLVPARTTALIFSSTSLRLLTMTILSSMDLFVEIFSTNRDLTCTKTLHSLCFKALMESLSIYLIYLFVALGNVHYALNFGIFESFSMYLELFE